MSAAGQGAGLPIQPDPYLSRVVPPQWLRRLLWLPDNVRAMGIHLMAGKGSGKSRLMGRVIGWQDFVRGTPLVVFDPVGSTIDNLLDKLTRLPREYQERLWKRILYVDMAGSGPRVVPFPLYYRLGSESLYSIAQRYVDTVRKIDPHLEKAPLLGLNAFIEMGTYSGMVLAASGLQITEASRLLADPGQWASIIAAAEAAYPELHPTADYFRHRYPALSASNRAAQTQSFLSKVALFELDPSMRAMFGASEQRIDWQEVIDRRMTVLLDFRGEHNLERRRFKMMWAFSYLTDFIKFRGRTRSQPVSVIVDELTELTDFDALGVNPFEKELNALINVYARNCMLWLTVAHQEAFQVSEYTLKTLMTMGTQILGVTTDPDAAAMLVRQYCPIDPLKIKRQEPVWMSVTVATDLSGRETHAPRIIDWRPVEYSVEEQQLLSAEQFKQLRLFEFLVKSPRAEGDPSSDLRPVSIRSLDAGQWVNEELVAEARGLLSARTGIPMQGALEEIDRRGRAQRAPALSPATAPAREERHSPTNRAPSRAGRDTSRPPKVEMPQQTAAPSDKLSGNHHHEHRQEETVDRHPDFDEVVREPIGAG